jgi:hypothetical protein
MNDYQIGNIVSHNGIFKEITGVIKGKYITQIIFEAILEKATVSHLVYPLLISEESIRMLPFWCFEFAENFQCYISKNGITIQQYGEGQEWLNHIKYIHQIQNLYKSLTGQEMLIKI